MRWKGYGAVRDPSRRAVPYAFSPTRFVLPVLRSLDQWQRQYSQIQSRGDIGSPTQVGAQMERLAASEAQAQLYTRRRRGSNYRTLKAGMRPSSIVRVRSVGAGGYAWEHRGDRGQCRSFGCDGSGPTAIRSCALDQKEKRVVGGSRAELQQLDDDRILTRRQRW